MPQIAGSEQSYLQPRGSALAVLIWLNQSLFIAGRSPLLFVIALEIFCKISLSEVGSEFDLEKPTGTLNISKSVDRYYPRKQSGPLPNLNKNFYTA